MQSFFSAGCLILAINAVFFAQLTAALTLYTNTSSSTTTSIASSSSSVDYFSAYSTGNWTLPTYYNTKSYWVGSTTKQYAIHHESVTAKPRISSEAQQLNEALQCFSTLVAWRNESASFRNDKIANRTWPVTSFWSSTSKSWSASSTIYPTNASTYKLCDGTPRVDIRPKTTHMSGNTTLWATFTSTMTPTYSSQPCSLSPRDCRLLYLDTDAQQKNENELLKQCGNPAHLEKDNPQCLLGGGPVELIYFPVETNNGSLCNNKTSEGITKPMVPGLSEIVTLGRTFTSESVYLSFKTLYATYDGFFGDYIGQTFTDLIVPLHSTDVSTQCGGWNRAFGAGTQLNYADLNWPVPASAYSCQQRCTLSLTSSAVLEPPQNTMLWNMETVSPGTECDTIWSDVNPVLAVPTKIRQMVPEWSSCSFWNANLANFWFDPPIALQPAQVVAVPTAPSNPQTTAAAAASTPTSPIASSTRAIFPSVSTGVSSSLHHKDPAKTASPATSVEDPAQPDTTLQMPPTMATAPHDDPVPVPSQLEPSSPDFEDGSTIVVPRPPTSAESVPPALSVLTEALSTGSPGSDPPHGPLDGESPLTVRPSTTPSIGNIVASVIGMVPNDQSTDVVFSYDPVDPGSTAVIAPAPSRPGSDQSEASLKPTLTFVPGDLTFAFTPSGGSSSLQTIVVDSQAIPSGDAATIFGQPVTHGSEGLALLPSPQSTDTATTASISSASVLVAGSLTLTIKAYTEASRSDAISVLGTILSPGGPAATIGGEVITKATDGLLLAGESPETFIPITKTSATASNTIFALGSITITASPDPHFVNGYLVDGTSMAWEDTIIVDGATVTAGWAGLEISGEEMSTVAAGAKSGSRNQTSMAVIPSVIIATSSSSPASTTAMTGPMSTSTLESAGTVGRPVYWLWVPTALLPMLYIGLG
ncbi:hypothetical protein CLAFUW4_14022 [Fulvia fulva]|nr:hypothetical protein CLAFUR4_14025 [Fulvia fulva]KAK4611156.1 hypothetical protein CLAFUR0_14029 [Fulvia fulva]WPV22214.1 hypothetical protein CLAFUW4_14022 [Fulvia fulva]